MSNYITWVVYHFLAIITEVVLFLFALINLSPEFDLGTDWLMWREGNKVKKIWASRKESLLKVDEKWERQQSEIKNDFER